MSMLCCYILCRIIFLSDGIFFLLLYLLLGFFYIYKTGMYEIIRNKGEV